MTKLIKKFVRNEDGAAAAEYALLLAIIGSTIAVAALAFGNAIAGVMNRAALLMAGILP